jgi:hypothetical protein
MELYFRVQIRDSVKGVCNIRFKFLDCKGMAAGTFWEGNNGFEIQLFTHSMVITAISPLGRLKD